MADLIIHHEGAYNIFGTIADAPHYESALTLDQLRQVMKDSYGERGLDLLPERLERVHRTGCSHIGGWTLDDCIAANRAGAHESTLTRDEFIAKYLTLPRGVLGTRAPALKLWCSGCNKPTTWALTLDLWKANYAEKCPACGGEITMAQDVSGVMASELPGSAYGTRALGPGHFDAEPARCRNCGGTWSQHDGKGRCPVGVTACPAYRLLTESDTIQEGDEFLDDDATTWQKADGTIFVGMKWKQPFKSCRRATPGVVVPHHQTFSPSPTDGASK